MKVYAVGITDAYGGGEAKFRAANKTEARSLARQYIRQWQLRNATIDYIREVQ